MSDLNWLFAVPIAHRGLHDVAQGVIENSATAAARAVARGFTIECDVQRSADGEAMVFHDSRLDRLTAARGRVANHATAALGALMLRETNDTIPTLTTFLTAIGGRVPVIVEIKSAFDGDMRLADRTAEIIAGAGMPIAIKSFDPDIIAHLRDHAGLAKAGVPRGVVAEAAYTDGEWTHLSADRKRDLAQFLHFDRSRPDFLSYRALDMPHAAPFLCRTALKLPVMAWTVRSPEQAQHGLRWADQIVFEGFNPAT